MASAERRDDGVEIADEELVVRYRAGHSSAFEELVRRYRSPLKRLVFRYVKDDATAEDVTQATLVRALQHLPQLEVTASFRTWLFRIGVHAALDHVRGSRPVDPTPLEDIVAFTHSLKTSRLVAAEVWLKVSAYLEHLPPKQRLIVELRAFHDMSFAEISAVADCSEESARVNFHHAVKRLREKLGPLV
jgi:RNA polymerase sigma-70 factor, ECF subfamily